MLSLKSNVVICLLGILYPNLLCAQFGELPGNDLFSGSINNVIGETSLAFYSNWAPQIDTQEFTFYRVESDSTKYLHLFAIADIASFQLDDSRDAQETKIGFWWVSLDKAPEVPVNHNYQHLIEMKLWTNNADLAQLYKTNDIECELAEIDIKYTDNTSFVELKSPNEHFQISLTELDSTARVVDYDVPIYMTIWPFSGGLHFYQLYTFYDHKVQYAKKVDFKVLNGKESDFTKTLNTAYLNSEVWGDLQTNWKARFGLYKKN